jgi:glutamate synthase domain-containing protein 3
MQGGGIFQLEKYGYLKSEKKTQSSELVSISSRDQCPESQNTLRSFLAVKNFSKKKRGRVILDVINHEELFLRFSHEVGCTLLQQNVVLCLYF